MRKIVLLLILKWSTVLSKEGKDNQNLQPAHTEKVYYQYAPPVVPFIDGIPKEQPQDSGYTVYLPPNLPLLSQTQIPKIDLHTVIEGNPLLAALLLSLSLGPSIKSVAPNHPELVPINPYIALLLSHYGRYVPYHGTGKGIYAYAAANNYHNNKPFGPYKVYENA